MAVTPRRSAALAFLWGFAEATLFFVVADVPVSLIAIRAGLRAGAVAAIWAAVGAILGGAVLYLWAGADPAGLARALDFVPAVSPGQIAETGQQLAEGWPRAVIRGGFIGNPYKLYAAAAGAQGIPPLPFLVVSLIARLLRFLLSVAAAQLLVTVLKRLGVERLVLPLWGLWWIDFYAWYWIRMPW